MLRQRGETRLAGSRTCFRPGTVASVGHSQRLCTNERFFRDTSPGNRGTDPGTGRVGLAFPANLEPLLESDHLTLRAGRPSGGTHEIETERTDPPLFVARIPQQNVIARRHRSGLEPTHQAAAGIEYLDSQLRIVARQVQVKRRCGPERIGRSQQHRHPRGRTVDRWDLGTGVGSESTAEKIEATATTSGIPSPSIFAARTTSFTFSGWNSSRVTSTITTPFP